MSILLNKKEIDKAYLTKFPWVEEGQKAIAKAQDIKTKKGLMNDLSAILKEAGDLRTLERSLADYVEAPKKEVKDG